MLLFSTKRYFGTEHGSEVEMTPSALNIKGGSASPISIDDNKGITITSPKKLTLNADFEIIMKTPKSVKINGVSQINVWEEMSNTISFLEEFLKNIEIMRIGEQYSVLYTIINQDNEIEYYQGNNPYEKRNNKKLDEFFKNAPSSIQNFYTNVHNGFYYYPSKGMGLSPYNDVICLGDYEWGIIDEIEEDNLKLNLETSFGFFNNSMGTYVIIDFSQNINNSILWSAKDEPDYELNFWDVVDEWMVIGFQ